MILEFYIYNPFIPLVLGTISVIVCSHSKPGVIAAFSGVASCFFGLAFIACMLMSVNKPKNDELADKIGEVVIKEVFKNRSGERFFKVESSDQELILSYDREVKVGETWTLLGTVISGNERYTHRRLYFDERVIK